MADRRSSFQRLDKALVARGLCRSRQSALELIKSKKVLLNGTVCEQPSQNISDLDSVTVLPNDLEKYVSRGGLKLENALEHFQVSVEKFVCLDIGQSTGGFTDCLLQAGAAVVAGVDVGSGQLSDKIRHDLRVHCYENVNLREANSQFIEQLKSHAPSGVYDLIVVDLSFISLSLVIDQLVQLGSPRTAYLLLVKPQFEVGKKGLDKGGIVTDPNKRSEAVTGIKSLLISRGFTVEPAYECKITGSDGNQEFFLYCKK